MGRLFAILILMLGGVGLTAHAGEVVLAQGGQFANNYGSLVKSLAPGDRVTLNGRTFTLGPFLGSGVASNVWSIGNGRALRLPKSSNHVVCQELLSFQEGVEAAPLMKNDWALMARSWAQAAQSLAEARAPVVRFYPNESEVPFSTVVERLMILSTAQEWLEFGDTGDPEMKGAWNQFLREMDRFESIGDLKLDSIGYVMGRGWVLMDFADPVTLRTTPLTSEHSPVYLRLKQLEKDQTEIRRYRFGRFGD